MCHGEDMDLCAEVLLQVTSSQVQCYNYCVRPESAAFDTAREIIEAQQLAIEEL